MWQELIGQEFSVKALQQAAQDSNEALTGKVMPGFSQAWLLTGPPGSGRSTAARLFAATLQCEENGCGKCVSCISVKNGTHPDVHVVAPQGLSYGIDDTKSLVREAALMPSLSQWNIIILEDADRLTTEAGNALLKAIEEPAKLTMWILCAPSSKDVLITIRSRCRIVSLRTPPAEAIAELLIKRDGIDKAIDKASSLENWIEADVVHSGNQRVQELIIDSGLNPADQYVALYFFTTLPIGSESGSKLITIANNAQKKYQEKGWNVECKVLGLAEIQDKYIELKNIRDYGLAGPVTFKIQKDFFFEIKDPLKVLVCGIRAGTIADIYNQKEVKNKLFNQNIRLPLSSSKINTAISQTATDPEASKNFFYYNNGITATCSSYEMVENEITVSDFQVVNGAQTVSALARSVGSGSAVKKSTNAVVLFRLIQTGEQISRKSELADNITRYQNTQNVVRESDFFSNELFQLWLTKNLPEQLSNK